MFYKPVRLGGRSLSVFFAVILSFYTFALMYMSRAPRCESYTILPDHVQTWNLRYGQVEISNSSERPFFGVPRLKITQTLSMKKFYKDKRRRLPKSSNKVKSRDVFSVQINVKQRTPRSNQPFSMKQRTLRDSQHLINNSYSYNMVSYFRARLQGISADVVRETVRVFDLVMTNNHLDYIIYGGTLIGSYRHHGLVPWDDDIDVLVPLAAKSSTHHALSNFSPDYILNNGWDFCWKFFSTFSDPISGCNWKWPYLDIFFYAENETHIWDTAPQYTKNFVYPKTIIFPLRRRPFIDLPLLAPHNPRAVIDTNYDISLCRSGTWIHKWERHGKETTVPCAVLFSKFPFVWRKSVDDGCNETLVKDGQIINFFFDEKVEC